jgi:tetratricopeptide (TPR) repeat protein
VVSQPIEVEIVRIRELSKAGRNAEALSAAEALATAAPGNRDALYLIAANQRCLNHISEALDTLQQLERQHPQFSLLYQERGYCYVTLRDASRAIEAFSRAVSLNSVLKTSWIMLERLYRMKGEINAATMAAEHAAKLQLDYIHTLLHEQKYPQAYEVIDPMLKVEPNNPDLRRMYAAACAGLGRHEAAIELYQQLLVESPESCVLCVLLGHSLQAVGRQTQAIESYRKAAAIRASFGDAYWSLANLKTYRFSPDEIARMREAEASPAADPVDRYHLCFALGKAYEDRNEYAESWQFYERGNALKRAESRYRPEITETNTRQQMEVCTAEFFSARAGVGAPAPDPIFILGLPRSGSTLVEQILASHSEVDGTQELPDIPSIVRRMDGCRSDVDHPRYPGLLRDLAPEEFRRLGERYLTDTRSYRGEQALFVDKMPNNFRHIGLIHLMLPNAKIIDVRREPMACCFSNLKQLFASGQEFAYSIEDIARYYQSYLELMRHWDAVLPGRVLRVWYEDVVEDLTGNVRRILEFCGLKFEPACVDFYQLERSVNTVSSEQVRQPIFREGLSGWRNYEPWLGPLKDALGDARIGYRGTLSPALDG